MDRLGVRLEGSSKGGVMVRHNSESSLVVHMKSKQYLDPLLMELNKLVLNKNNEYFCQGEDGVLRYQGMLSVLDVDGLMDKIMEEVHGPDTPSIRGPPKCIMTCVISIGGIK